MQRVCVIGNVTEETEDMIDYLSQTPDLLITVVTTDIISTNDNVVIVESRFEDLFADFYSNFDLVVYMSLSTAFSSSSVQIVYNNILKLAYILDVVAESGESPVFIFVSHRTLVKYSSIELVNSLRTLQYEMCASSKTHAYVIEAGSPNLLEFPDDKDTRIDVTFAKDIATAIETLYTITKTKNINTPVIHSVVSCNVSVNDISYCKEICEYKTKNKVIDSAIQQRTYVQSTQDTLCPCPTSLSNIMLVPKRTTQSTRIWSYTYKRNCFVCGCVTNSLLDLHNQPLANEYTTTVTAGAQYPLHLYSCPNCFHVQLNCVVNPDNLFKNYLYVSGTSQTNKDHFAYFAKTYLKDAHKVLDIASNDNSQLDAVQRLCNNTCITVGVEPATNIIPKKSQHIVYNSFFNSQIADELSDKFESFDAIVCQNVFAHIDYPHTFMQLCSRLMTRDSRLYIQTSQADMIINAEFDTVYHEHLSFYNTKSMKMLCEMNSLVLYRVDIAPVHGNSYIFTIAKASSHIVPQDSVLARIQHETEQGLYDAFTYQVMYPLRTQKYISDILEFFTNKSKRKRIVCVGSTAKFNVILNSVPELKNCISEMIDENPLKQDLYLPNCKIQVKSFQTHTHTPNTVYIITAWNYTSELASKIRKEVSSDCEVYTIHPLGNKV